MDEWQAKQRAREAADRAAGRVKRVERQPHWHRWWYPPAWSDCHACVGQGWAYDEYWLEAYCDCEAGRRRRDAEASEGPIEVDWPVGEES